MREAAQAFLGTHDFTSFCSARTEVVDRVRTIKRLDLLETEQVRLHMVIEGDGFLYNMVRIIAGNLWEVGIGSTRAGLTSSECLTQWIAKRQEKPRLHTVCT